MWKALTKDTYKENKDKQLYIFKRSATCGLSNMVEERLKELLDNHEEDIYVVTVQTQRKLSDAIASDLEIKHETPQMIIVENGEVKAHTSHNAITKDWLTNQLS